MHFCKIIDVNNLSLGDILEPQEPGFSETLTPMSHIPISIKQERRLKQKNRKSRGLGLRVKRRPVRQPPSIKRARLLAQEKHRVCRSAKK